jgi:hypothetical protein
VFNVFQHENHNTPRCVRTGRRANRRGRALANYLQPSSAFAARQAQVGVRAEY